MANVLVTESADGIGRQTAVALLDKGHRVVLHAPTDARADEVRAAVPAAAGVVVGQLTSITQTRQVAKAADAHGPFDAIVHTAAAFEASHLRPVTADGLERTFQANVLAPYLLSAHLPPPRRLVFLVCDLQAEGRPDLNDLQHEHRPWDARQAYCDAALYRVALSLAIAGLWPRTSSNAVNAVEHMARTAATTSRGLGTATDTQVWLATSDDPDAAATGRYLRQHRDISANPAAYQQRLQEGLLAACAELAGISLPV